MVLTQGNNYYYFVSRHSCNCAVGSLSRLSLFDVKGAHKKTVFFYFRSKGGGSLSIQKFLIRKYSDFLDQRGGGLTQSKRVLSDFWHNFCIYLEKYHCICKEVRVCSQAILGCQNSLNLQLV